MSLLDRTAKLRSAASWVSNIGSSGAASSSSSSSFQHGSAGGGSGGGKGGKQGGSQQGKGGRAYQGRRNSGVSANLLLAGSDGEMDDHSRSSGSSESLLVTLLRPILQL